MDNENHPNNAGSEGAMPAMWKPDKDRDINDYKNAIDALERAYRDGSAKTDDIIELARLYYDGAGNLTAAITLLSDALSKARDQLSKIKYIYEALRAVNMSDSTKQMQLQKALYGKLEGAIKGAGNTRLEYTAFLDCLYDALLRRDFGSVERLSSMYEALNIKENELRRYYKTIKRLEGLYRNGKVHPAVETILNPNTKRMPKNAAPLIIKQIRQIAGSLKTLRGEVPELFKKHAGLEQLQNAAAMRYDLFSEFNRMEDDGAISPDIKELTRMLLIIKYFGADEFDVSVFKAKAEHFLSGAPMESRAAAIRRMEEYYPDCFKLFSNSILGGKSAYDLFGPDPGDELVPYTEWHSKARREQPQDLDGEDDSQADNAPEKPQPADWKYEAPEPESKTAERRAPKAWEYEAPEETEKKPKRTRQEKDSPQEAQQPSRSAPKAWEYEAPEEAEKKSKNTQSDKGALQPTKEPAEPAARDEVSQQEIRENPREKIPGDGNDSAQVTEGAVQTTQAPESAAQSVAPQSEHATVPTEEPSPQTEEAYQKAQKPKQFKQKKRRKKQKAAVFTQPGAAQSQRGQSGGGGKAVRAIILAVAVLAGIAFGVNACNNIKPDALQSQTGGPGSRENQEIKALSEKYQAETGAVISIEQYKNVQDEAARAKAPSDGRGFITLRITGDANSPQGVSVGLASNCLPENEFNRLEQQSRDAFGGSAPVSADKIKEFFDNAYDSLKSAYDKFPISAISNPFITYKILQESGDNGDMTRVPAVYGMSVDQARAKLAEYGLGISVTEKDNNKYTPGRVYRQQPEFGVLAKKGDVVTVTVPPGGDTGAAVITQDENSVIVPDLIGMTEQQALAATAGLSLEISQQALGDGTPAGQIVSQQPAAGVTLQKGATVKAVVSAGETDLADRIYELMRAVAGQNYSMAQVLSYFGIAADASVSQMQTADGQTVYSGTLGAPLFGVSGSLEFELQVTPAGQAKAIACRWTPSAQTTLGDFGELAKAAGFTASQTAANQSGGYSTVYSSRQGKLNVVSAGDGDDAGVEYVELRV